MRLAMRVLNDDASHREYLMMRAALELAWPEASETSKRIAEADAEWFLARALEALGENPHEALAARRMRVSRAARSRPKG